MTTPYPRTVQLIAEQGALMLSECLEEVHNGIFTMRSKPESALTKKALRKRKRLAKKDGFFWLPCSVCGEHFGGNESGLYSDYGAIPDGANSGEMICKWCSEAWRKACS